MVEKLAVVKGDNLNADRCVTIDIMNAEVICCMDELSRGIRICKINGEDTKDLEGEIYVTELIKLATNVVYMEADNDKYDFYLDDIRMSTQCCEEGCGSCKNYRNK